MNLKPAIFNSLTGIGCQFLGFEPVLTDSELKMLMTKKRTTKEGKSVRAVAVESEPKTTRPESPSRR
ncbi:MAG TPA: hypothetical protein VIF10_17155 [Methylobacter sp.]